MPQSTFARMVHTDHSMRPPAPAASLAFGSPDACTLCHADRDVRWSDRWVRRWYGRGYQDAVLRSGRLVAAARAQDWRRLGDILAYLRQPHREEVVAASLTRMLEACRDPAARAALRTLARDPSPLVRAAAVVGLAGDGEAVDVLIRAVRDDIRVVRVRAAYSLAGHDLKGYSEADVRAVADATRELTASLAGRLDQLGSHYTLGNLDLAQGDPAAAAYHYERALLLQPGHVPSLVNLAIAQARRGNGAGALAALQQALRLDPDNEVVRFNLSLLRGATP
jgi:tetratricopeptide (TPR) repeat protein